MNIKLEFSRNLILRASIFERNLKFFYCKTYLSEDGVSIVSEHDTSHWIEEHFKHGLWSKGSSDNITNSLGSLNISSLGIFALFSLSVLVKNDNWRLHMI